jgi:hypothetical protein
MKIRVSSAAAVLAAVLIVSTGIPLAAADVIGKISYLEGRVEIVRDEGSLDAKIVKEGLALENFDLLKVGADGEVEVQVTSPAAAPATLRVGPRTQFSIEIGKVDTKQRTTLDLIAGSVAMKCGKLTGAQEMRVKTEAAVVGVRGTDFTVTAPASGDLLITCDTGEVECTDGKGTILRAGAGEAIEQRWGTAIARAVITLREWQDRENSALTSDPLKFAAAHARLFNFRLRSFDRQFARMKRWQKSFDGWQQEHQRGIIGRAMQEGIQRWKLEKDLRGVRWTLFLLERTWVRLLELKEYCTEQGIKGRIGLCSSEAFFDRLEQRRFGIEFRRARVRFWERLFVDRNDGILLPALESMLK